MQKTVNLEITFWSELTQVPFLFYFSDEDELFKMSLSGREKRGFMLQYIILICLFFFALNKAHITLIQSIDFIFQCEECYEYSCVK